MALAGPAFLGRLTGESRVPLAPGAPGCLLTCAPSAPCADQPFARFVPHQQAR